LGVVTKVIDLAHPLVQHGSDAHDAVFKHAPLDEMLFVASEKAVDPEFGWYLPPRNPLGRDVLELGNSPRMSRAACSSPQVSRV
jgi:hypothetical protein